MYSLSFYVGTLYMFYTLLAIIIIMSICINKSTWLFLSLLKSWFYIQLQQIVQNRHDNNKIIFIYLKEFCMTLMCACYPYTYALCVNYRPQSIQRDSKDRSISQDDQLVPLNFHDSCLIAWLYDTWKILVLS